MVPCIKLLVCARTTNRAALAYVPSVLINPILMARHKILACDREARVKK